jgi:hypothetical protein
MPCNAPTSVNEIHCDIAKKQSKHIIMQALGKLVVDNAEV